MPKINILFFFEFSIILVIFEYTQEVVSKFIFRAKSIRFELVLLFFANQLTKTGSIGMQWPPTPGPGVNAVKPNGFVSAASITL